MAGDAHWSSVLALLHFDGSAGTQTITESSDGTPTISVSGSGAQLSSAQSLTGGVSWLGASGSYFELDVGSAASFTGDFTLEWYGHSMADGQCVFYSTLGGAYLYGGSFQDYGGSALSLSVSQSAWKHFAICRQGSTMRAYVGGVQTGTATYSGTVDLRTTQWGRYVPNNNLYSTGYVDELRLTAGVCRYPDGTTFTPPGTAWPEGLPPTEAYLAAGPLLGQGAMLVGNTSARMEAGPLLGQAAILLEFTAGYIDAGPLLAPASMLAASTYASADAGPILAQASMLADSTHARIDAGPLLRQAAMLAAIPATAHISAGPILTPAAVLAWSDFTLAIDGRQPTHYVMDLLTGSTLTRVPISSWQATLQTGADSYVQCVVPAASQWLDAILAADEFIISRRTTLVGGQVIEYEMARAPLDTPQRAQGPERFSITLSGYTSAFAAVADPPTYLDRTLAGARQVNTSSRLRLRASIDWLLRPGHRAYWGDVDFIVGYINYYVPGPDTDAYMDVGEADTAIA